MKPVSVTVTPRDGASSSRHTEDETGHAEAGHTVQVGHKYKALLTSKFMANANQDQFNQGIPCELIITKDEGPTARRNPLPPPQQQAAPPYPRTAFHNNVPPGHIQKFSASTVPTITGSVVDSDSNEGRVVLWSPNLESEPAAVAAWASLAATRVNFDFRPERPDATYFMHQASNFVNRPFNREYRHERGDAVQAMLHHSANCPEYFAKAMLFTTAEPDGRKILNIIHEKIVDKRAFLSEDMVICSIREIVDHLALAPPPSWMGNGSHHIEKSAELISMFLYHERARDAAQFSNQFSALMREMLVTRFMPHGIAPSYLARRQALVVAATLGGALHCAKVFKSDDHEFNERVGSFVDTAVDVLVSAAGPGAPVAALAGGLIKRGVRELQSERDFKEAIHKARGAFRLGLLHQAAVLASQDRALPLDLNEFLKVFESAINACGEV